MTPEDYEIFFEKLATSFKPIGHVAGLNNRFVIARVYDSDAEVFKHFDKTSLNMLLEEYVSDPGVNEAGQLVVKNTGSFAIVKHFDAKKQKNQRHIRRETWQAALMIWAKMLELQEEDPRLYNWDRESFTMDPEGPMFDNFYGYRVEFSFTDILEDQNLTDTDAWLPLT